MSRRLPSLAAAAFVTLAGAPALAATASLPPPDAIGAVSRDAAEYRIGVEDELEINVFGLEELKRTVKVDTSGRIILPLVGAVPAAGRSVPELSADITTALKSKYMKDPQVIVSVKEAQSQKVTVDGAVQSPGVYPIAGPTTLMQALSMAKGPDTKLANVKKVAIFRTVGGTRRQAVYDLTAIRAGKAEDPQVYGNDIVVVDTSAAKSFLQTGGFGILSMLLRPF